jgi:hypothetical protein
VVKKLGKGKTAPKIASQPPKKQDQNKKDEKIEYARSVFLVSFRIQEGYISRVELDTKMVTSTTLL